MDRPELDIQGAVSSLPRAHFLLLRAALAGFDEGELAALVDVPPESVRPLLRIAAAKLSTCLATTGADPAADTDAGGQSDTGTDADRKADTDRRADGDGDGEQRDEGGLAD